MTDREPHPLRRIADEALDLHADAPDDAGRHLMQGLSHLPGDDESAAHFARTVEHVLLGHLADVEAFRVALQREAAHPGLAQAVARGRLALALMSDSSAAPAAALSLAERVRAHYNAALALTRAGRWAEARHLLACAQAVADAGEPDALRAYAAITNNVAGDVRYYFKPEHRSDAERVATMLDAARRAREAWARAGGWMETERADYQLALCHAVAGQGEPAVAHAKSCLHRCEANGADAFELFFAQEAMALAHHAADQPAAVEAAREHMDSLLARVTDEESRAFAAPSLQKVEALLRQ